jgi:hypothetical protein
VHVIVGDDHLGFPGEPAVLGLLNDGRNVNRRGDPARKRKAQAHDRLFRLPAIDQELPGTGLNLGGEPKQIFTAADQYQRLGRIKPGLQPGNA